MKAILLLFLSLVLFWEQSWAQIEFKSLDEAVKKLSAYQTKDLEKDKQNVAQKKPLVIDQMFLDLKASVKLSEKRSSEELIQQMGRVAVITFKHDLTSYAAEILLPVYLKNKQQFEKSLKPLPKPDQEILIEALKAHEHEDKEGNG